MGACSSTNAHRRSSAHELTCTQHGRRNSASDEQWLHACSEPVAASKANLEARVESLSDPNYGDCATRLQGDTWSSLTREPATASKPL